MSVALAITSLLSGCISSAKPPVVEKVVLDWENGIFTLPLEKFAMSWQDQWTVFQANAVMIARCLADRGYPSPVAEVDWTLLPPDDTRTYGVWAPRVAENRGYDPPASFYGDVLAERRELLGPEWERASKRCSGETQGARLPTMGVYTQMEFSLVDRGMDESYQALLASGVYRDEWEKWAECITAEGLVPDPDRATLSPISDFEGDPEVLIRQAIIDTTCKQQLGTMQKIVDVEAEVQSRFIARNEGALLRHQAEAREIVEKARAIIAAGY
ncbi:hypothetical protein [Mycetocola tolaasinivorans]|uniref:hypothetical protein n=1 Tax=Mycetocola tolaasinivorans TaxID=76635 RepID=UPI0011C49D3F|nr:hypothetical protein [Mycetocola tolaasinivorans]